MHTRRLMAVHLRYVTHMGDVELHYGARGLVLFQYSIGIKVCIVSLHYSVEICRRMLCCWVSCIDSSYWFYLCTGLILLKFRIRVSLIEQLTVSISIFHPDIIWRCTTRPCRILFIPFRNWTLCRMRHIVVIDYAEPFIKNGRRFGLFVIPLLI